MKISVVIPVYNGRRCLRRTIKSLMRQTFKDWEVICVNDCSTDCTSDYLARLSRQDARIGYVEMQENSGPLACRLRGIEEASGQYIAFADAGDRIFPHGLQSMLAAAAAVKADVVVGATFLRIGRTPLRRLYFSPRLSLGSREIHGCDHDDVARIYNALLSGKLTGSCCDKIYSAELLKAHAPENLDVRISEDLYFNAYILPFTRIISLTDVAYYEWQYSGMGKKYYLKKFGDLIKVYEHIFCNFSNLAGNFSDSEISAFQASFSLGFMSHFVEGVVERLNSQGEKSALSFASDIIQLPLMDKVKRNLDSYEDVAVEALKPPTMIALARKRLREHRKFYIFTRILNIFTST